MAGEFGESKWEFTDDVNDEGIDAIVWRPNHIPPVVLLQSKLTDKIDRLILGRTAIRARQY
jgi:hypothetical protein